MRLVAIAAALTFAASVHAGSLGLTWNATEDTAGYKVYAGTASGAYDLVQGQVVADGTSTVLFDLPDCQDIYVAVTAYNDWGESAYSDEVQAYTRPNLTVGGVAPVQGETTWTLTGNGFVQDALALKINGSPVQDLTVLSCTAATFNAVQVPGASEWTAVQVCNTVPSGEVCGPVMVPTKPNSPSNIIVN